MVTLIKYTLAAALAVGAASASLHGAAHFPHARRHAHPQVQRRDSIEPQSSTALVLVYELEGKILDAEEAKAGLEKGDFVVVDESTPTPVPAKLAHPSSKDMKAQFIEINSSSSSSNISTTTSPASSSSSSTSASTSVSTSAPPPTTTSSDSSSTSIATATSAPPASSTTAAPSKAASAAKNAQAVSSPGGAGLTSDFPSGKVPCSQFPSDYGALALPYLGFAGWSGLQYVPAYFIGASAISEIITGIVGETCKPGSMCSYACPLGYQKTQWPKAQGDSNQSIGGLYCNNDGFLELTRGSVTKQLCEPGMGGVTVQNDLDEVVSLCRTDFPGSEAMVIPAEAQPGSTIPLCNPSQTKYYQWGHKKLATSAQYYLNKKGLSAEKACRWNCDEDHDACGNWSPAIIGLGEDDTGVTYLSVFANLPTSYALLDFNVEITGDVNTKCAFVNGKYTGGENGCTTAMPPGGKAIIRYF